MEEIFITAISLEKIRNLDHVMIPLSGSSRKHLILTGKNGSGKTTVLEALSKALDDLTSSEEQLMATAVIESKTNLRHGLSIRFNCPLKMVHQAFTAGSFIIAYYKAERTFEAEVSRHVEKVELKKTYSPEESPRKDFVKYLVDMKVTQALAVSKNNTEKAEKIQKWFIDFERLLRRILENDQLTLNFDEDTFQFHLCEPQKEPYDFNTLSSGYAAILDIVVDLILRMEHHSNRRFQYDLPGIVLIDEIETHLHLELQKKILDLLTTVFPNIQFIVSSHSPFILNSIDDAIIYDLEQKTLVQHGLSNVPYDGIVEGYFNANVLSEELRTKFERYKTLVKKHSLTDDEIEEIMHLELYLDEIPDYLALDLTTEYKRLKLEYSAQEEENGQN